MAGRSGVGPGPRAVRGAAALECGPLLKRSGNPYGGPLSLSWEEVKAARARRTPKPLRGNGRLPSQSAIANQKSNEHTLVTGGEKCPRTHHRALCAVGWSLPAVAGTDRAPLRPARWLRRATARNVAGRNGARMHHRIGMRRGQKGGQKAPIRDQFRPKTQKKSKKAHDSALPILTFRPPNRPGASARPDSVSKMGKNPPKSTQNRPPTYRPSAICPSSRPYSTSATVGGSRASQVAHLSPLVPRALQPSAGRRLPGPAGDCTRQMAADGGHVARKR